MQIFCDFDGTITNRDSIVFLTEEFGGGAEFRLEVLEDIKAGRMSVFEAIEDELATVQVEWGDAVVSLRKAIHVDPTFAPFVEWCRKQNCPLTVVSSGMEPVVRLFIGAFDIPYFAHPVDVSRAGWIYRRNPLHDKKFLLEEARKKGEVVFIGDGTSDVAAIEFADLLFAKRGHFLAAYCRGESIRYYPYDDFFEIQETLESILEERTPQAP